MTEKIPFKTGDRVRLTVENTYLMEYHGAAKGALGTLLGDFAGIAPGYPITNVMVRWDTDPEPVGAVRCSFDEFELVSPDDPQTLNPTAGELAATVRLAFARKQHPLLVRDETTARVKLAAAIIAMDEANGQPGRHNLAEQAAVHEALTAYGDALANLVRGEHESHSVYQVELCR